MSEGNSKSKIFAIRTTIGQEKNVIRMIEAKSRSKQLEIYSLFSPDELRGYVLVEAPERRDVLEAMTGIPHAKGVLEGEVPFSEIEHFLEEKPPIKGLDIGDIVELISGPFKGEKAKVIRVDKGKEEVTIELIEATVPIPVTVKADYVRILEKKEEEEEI